MRTTDIVASVLAGGVLFLWLRNKGRKSVHLPPGPKPVPVLGNVRDLVTKELWLPVTQWAKQYGDVIYVHVLGQGLIFLNSREACMDLLEGRGSLYSDKPPLVMVTELCGCEDMVAFTRYGENSRRQRKVMNKAFGVSAIPAYHPLLLQSTNTFINGLLSTPTSYHSLIRRYAGGMTLQVVYGYRPQPSNDPFLELAEECVDILSNEIASGGGIWPVDLIPALKNLPDWAPGAGFKAKARKWKVKMNEFTDRPYEYMKSAVRSGEYAPSFCSTILEDRIDKMSAQEEHDLKWVANSMYSASGDTTVTGVAHFLIAMMQHPDKLAKAQQEMDSVVGSDRLPDFSDRADLPYLEAVFAETLRWGAPVPLNLPHRLSEDDVYNGQFLPKGSLVFGNIWALTRDETLFPDADSFIPERYLEKVDEETQKKMDPRGFVFGFGRRACPGQHLVEHSIWILFARMIATLDIGIVPNEKGEKPLPEIRFDNSIFRIPNEFPVDLRPRSQAAISLVRGAESEGL